MTANATPNDKQRTQTRLGLAAMLIPIFFVIGFATCIIGTYHKPHPNHIKFAVVGPAAQTARLQAGIQKAAPSSFEVSGVTTVDEAVKDVRNRDLDAAFAPTADVKQPATVIVATGGGRLVAVAAETLARSVTSSLGAQLVVRDVRPLAAGDAIGLGIFLFMIVCTICGYLAATLLFTIAPELAPRRRYAMLAATAVVVPVIAYLIGGLGFGTYEGSFGTILAFIAVASLYTFVVALVTRLLQVVLGPPALFVSLAIFVFLNIPSLGATYTSTMLAPFWRFLNHFWLGAETVNAERSILYFGGEDVGGDLLRLLAWTAVIVLLLVLPVSRKLERQREPAEHRAPPETASVAQV
jgi:hypothetical protein